MTDVVFDLDEIQSFAPKLPNGIVIARLSNADVTQTQSGKDQLSVTFEIAKGDTLGQEFTKRYQLEPWIDKNGKPRFFGLEEFKDEAGRIGAKGYKTKVTSVEFKRLYVQLFGKKLLRIAVTEHADKKKKRDDGTPVVYKDYRVIGLADESKAASKPSADEDEE